MKQFGQKEFTEYAEKQIGTVTTHNLQLEESIYKPPTNRFSVSDRLRTITSHSHIDQNHGGYTCQYNLR